MTFSLRLLRRILTGKPIPLRCTQCHRYCLGSYDIDYDHGRPRHWCRNCHPVGQENPTP